MIPSSQNDKDFPWWLLAVAGLGAFAFWQVLADDQYRQVLTTLQVGS